MDDLRARDRQAGARHLTASGGEAGNAGTPGTPGNSGNEHSNGIGNGGRPAVEVSLPEVQTPIGNVNVNGNGANVKVPLGLVRTVATDVVTTTTTTTSVVNGVTTTAATDIAALLG